MKILVISNSPFRTDSNLGKTLSALFREFNSNELHQLYFHSSIPDVCSCEEYYQISEKQIIESCFGVVKKRCGRIINKPVTSLFLNKSHSFLKEKKDSTILLWFREELWKCSWWNHSVLQQWISAWAPQLIFFVLSNSASRANFVRKLSKDRDCPVILYVTDDYYHDMRLKSSFARKLFYCNLQKSIRRMSSCVKAVIGCSELASKEFSELLHVNGKTVFTPYSIECDKISFKRRGNYPLILRYFGNLTLERWKVLHVLGEKIARINGDGRKAFLEIYSSQPSREILDAVNVTNGSQYMGWVSGEKYWKLLEDADISVHVESFSEEACRRTRLSISTKIADYLGPGKCILAVGREDLASIQHLKDCACIVNRPEDIDSALEDLFQNQSRRFELAESAREKAVLQHDPHHVSKQLRQIFSESLQCNIDTVK